MSRKKNGKGLKQIQELLNDGYAKELDKFRKHLGEYEDWKEKILVLRETKLRKMLQIPISHITENR